MKRINKKLQMALLRGVTVLSSLMVTMCAILFCDSLNACTLGLLIGASVATLVDETIKSKYHVL